MLLDCWYFHSCTRKNTRTQTQVTHTHYLHKTINKRPTKFRIGCGLGLYNMYVINIIQTQLTHLFCFYSRCASLPYADRERNRNHSAYVFCVRLRACLHVCASHSCASRLWTRVTQEACHICPCAWDTRTRSHNWVEMENEPTQMYRTHRRCRRIQKPHWWNEDSENVALRRRVAIIRMIPP